MSERARILVVDDNAHQLRATARLLKQAGYRVRGAGTGAEGLRLANAQRPDLILVRAVLPDIDGIELCQRIKGKQALDGCFVIMLSDVQATSDDRAGGMEAGADGYITRPISDRELLARVMALLRIQRTQADIADIESDARRAIETANFAASVRAAETPQEHEARNRALLNALPDLMFVLRRDGTYLSYHAANADALYVPPEQFLGKKVQEVFPEELAATFLDLIEQVIATGKMQFFEYHLPIGGQLRHFEARIVPYGEENVLSIIRDITERKRAEADRARATKALRESEERFRKIVENTQAGYFYIDRDGRFQRVNDAWMQMHGYTSPDEVIGQHFSLAQVEADMEKARRTVERLLGGESIPTGEFARRCKDGSIGHHTFSAVPVVHGGEVVGLEGFIIDTTERVRAEAEVADIARASARASARAAEALRQERDRAQKYLDIAGVMFVALDVNGEITLINQRGSEILGYDQEEIIGKNWFDRFVPRNIRSQVRAVFHKLIAGEIEPVECYENPVVTQDGEERIIAWHNAILKDDQGNPIGTLSSGEDITERKRTEEALRESESQKNLILNATAEMVAYYDRDLRVVWANRAAGQSVGKSPQELVGLHCYEVWHQRSEPCAGCPVLEARDAKEPQQGEQQTPDGRYWFLRGYPVLDEEDKVIGLVEFGQDISERKRAEAEIARAAEALQESEEELTLTLNATTEGIWKWEFESNELSFSPRYYTMLGYEPDEFPASYESWVSLIHPDDRQQALAVAEEYLATKTDYYENEFRLRTKGGDYRWIRTEARVVARDEQGQALRMIGNHRDITQRKRAEAEVARAAEALRRRNRELATLNRAGQALVSILDLDQVLVKVLEEVRGLLSVTASSIWLVDPETSELVCKQVTGPQKERVRGWRLAPGQGLAGRAARSGQSLIAPDVRADERHFKEVDRQTGLPLRSILTIPLRIKNGVIGVLQVVDTEVDRFDAGDLKLLEPLVTSAAIAIENARLYQQTRRDAETRSALLREVNHRVKNNLTSILGLLYTARDRVQVDERAAYLCTMDALIRRVRGLATAHDLLSASRWAPLRLSDLASRVIHVSLETLSRHKRVSVHVPVSPVRVTADQAHNLALVIGELTTNAAKHALKGRDTACISFQVELEDEDGDDLEHASPMIRCEFRDDGPGYPEEVLALERRNVGFDLIHNIVRKGLRGTLTLHNDGGAVAVIRFEAQVQER